MTDPLAAWMLAVSPVRPVRLGVLSDVDEIAVERACRGDRTVSLNRAEMALAFHYLDSHGYSARRVGELLGVSGRSVFRWRAGLNFPCSRTTSGRLAERRGLAPLIGPELTDRGAA